VAHPRYDAFVSYSHQDAALAERMSRRIRTYRPPRATSLPRRRLQVFRDRERLTASSDIGRSLSETVGASAHLVLLAPAAAAQSAYVNQEVASFLEDKGDSHLSVVVCGGELPDNLPPSLRARVREPLYIDLRPPGRRVFRLESLRLIAALLGVDYSVLRREDDLRRRRHQAFAVAATLVLAAGAGSAYLVTTTPAEAWELVQQPETTTGRDPLMPIERIAVGAQDPSTVVWLGENARYKRDLAAVKETWAPLADKLGDFDARAGAALAASHDPAQALTPLATASLDISDSRDRIGSGELQVYGFLDNGVLRFGRTFRFVPLAPDGRMVTLPLTAVEQGRSAFDLEPWPADALRRAGLNTSALTIDATIQDQTSNGATIRTGFFVSDNRGDIREVLGATAGQEHVVLSTSAEIADRLRDDLESLGAEDLWSDLAANAEWVVYRPPTPDKPVTIVRKSQDLRADARAAGLDADLVAALDPDLRGDFVEVERITRAVGAQCVSVATLAGAWDSHEAVAAPPPAHYLYAGLPGRWLRMVLPLETPSTRIVDVTALDAGLETILVSSDREGIFRTADGGATWESANCGESRLRNGERVRVIVSGSTVFALAAIGRQPGDDPNPLFRLAHRNWWRRWRLGMASLLAGPPS
jgi:hypothetical protein